jgi:Ca2+-binding RTX toxin-like protein
MKKLKPIRRIFTIFMAFALVIGSVRLYQLLAPSTVYAVGDLAVNWGVAEGNPIFTINNMAPGQVETRSVIVTNNAVSVRPVGVRGVQTSETGGLPSVLDIAISESGTDIYGGTAGTKTLAQFFIDSSGPDGIFLSDLGVSQTKTITFKVTFNQSAGNQYQAKNVVFDLKIGISIPLPEQCDNIQFNPQPIFGTQGRDVLNGTDGNDLIIALEGNDVINAEAGDDCIIAGDGNDIVHGQNGSDVIFGGEGNDTIDGDNGNDYIDGGVGDDKIKGNNGNDTILAGQGNDEVDGENDNDIIQGNDGNDDLRGGNGNDSLIGGLGTDKARGDNGQDTCDAESEQSCEL